MNIILQNFAIFAILVNLCVSGLLHAAEFPQGFRAATESDLIVCLHDENGRWLGIQAGDTLTISALDVTAGQRVNILIEASDTATVGFLINKLTDIFNQIDGAVTVSLNADGSITINTQACGKDIAEAYIKTDNARSYPYLINYSYWHSLPAGHTYKNSGYATIKSSFATPPDCAPDSLPPLKESTILHSSRFLAAGRDMDGHPNILPLEYTLLTCLFNENGACLGIQAGDSITVSARNVGAGTTESIGFAVESTTIFDYLRDRITDVFNLVDGAISVGINANGTLTTNALAAGNNADSLVVSSNNMNADSLLQGTLSCPFSLAAGHTYNTPGAVRRPASPLDELYDFYGANGKPLGLEFADEIRVNGTIGGKPTPTGTLTYAAGTTMQQLSARHFACQTQTAHLTTCQQ